MMINTSEMTRSDGFSGNQKKRGVYPVHSEINLWLCQASLKALRVM